MEFDSKDPTSPEFWDQRFARQFTPWDTGGVPRELQEFAARFSGVKSCLIPGCGNAWEAGWLAGQGWHVDAIDFSAEAVHNAQRLLGEAGGVVRHADFFDFTPAQSPGLIYERAFLCALPPQRRGAIVARWAELLPPGGLLAGYFYIDDSAERSPKGPPFSIAGAELHALLAPDFELSEQQPVDNSLAVFTGKESWQVWRRRS